MLLYYHKPQSHAIYISLSLQHYCFTVWYLVKKVQSFIFHQRCVTKPKYIKNFCYPTGRISVDYMKDKEYRTENIIKNYVHN